MGMVANKTVKNKSNDAGFLYMYSIDIYTRTLSKINAFTKSEKSTYIVNIMLEFIYEYF